MGMGGYSESSPKSRPSGPDFWTERRSRQDHAYSKQAEGVPYFSALSGITPSRFLFAKLSSRRLPISLCCAKSKRALQQRSFTAGDKASKVVAADTSNWSLSYVLTAEETSANSCYFQCMTSRQGRWICDHSMMDIYNLIHDIIKSCETLRLVDSPVGSHTST